MKNIIIIFVCIFFIGCSKQAEDDTTKIGVVLGLTGKYSNLGSSEKDGIILAFDKINYEVNDKKIELIFKDDQQNKASNNKAINELISDDVKIIIGNATSSMSKISHDIISKYKDIFQFSPSASSSSFSGKKDNFFRVQPANSIEHFTNLVKLLKKHNAKHIYLVGDKKNKAYLNDYINILNKTPDMHYEAIIDASSPYQDILNELKHADFIVQVQNSLDAANLTQYLRINNNNTPIILSGWAMDSQFLENSGKWANGIYFISSDYINYKDKEYINFAKEFYQFYKKQPNKQNMQGYQTAQIIIESLENDYNTADEIKKYILKKETFNLLGDELSFDEYGDIKTPFYLFQVINNKIEKID